MNRVRPFKHSQEPDDDKLIFWCPACEAPHWVRIRGHHTELWFWNGDLEFPTFEPECLIAPYTDKQCHFSVFLGMIQYAQDCSHHLRGRTVMMPVWGEYDPVKWRDEHSELYESA